MRSCTMTHRVAFHTARLLLLIGWLLLPGEALSQALPDHTAYPQFASGAIPPNILLVLDNSGSMNTKAYQDPFDPTKTYFGIFDSLECYDYGSNKFFPDPTANPATPGTCNNGTY